MTVHADDIEVSNASTAYFALALLGHYSRPHSCRAKFCLPQPAPTENVRRLHTLSDSQYTATVRVLAHHLLYKSLNRPTNRIAATMKDFKLAQHDRCTLTMRQLIEGGNVMLKKRR